MNFDFIPTKEIVTWLTSHGLKIIAIAVVALILNRVAKYFIEKLVRRLILSHTEGDKEAEIKREDTLIRIFNVSSSVIIWVIAGLMIVEEFGVAIGPLLAAAGVAGLALGFGGQYLIRDLIAGLFMITENQYRIGDAVSFDGDSGVVEDITLRMTTLRDLNGTVHHISHGEIKRVSNLSKSFSRVNLDIGVSYSSKLEEVISVINKVGKELAEDDKFKDLIIKAPEFLRVEDFADSAIIVKILGDTRPLKQWEVTGELRKRLKLAFDEAGIEIPFPQRVVHQSKE
jgi:moderate conductance mechanosensitive channel